MCLQYSGTPYPWSCIHEFQYPWNSPLRAVTHSFGPGIPNGIWQCFFDVFCTCTLLYTAILTGTLSQNLLHHSAPLLFSKMAAMEDEWRSFSQEEHWVVTHPWLPALYASLLRSPSEFIWMYLELSAQKTAAEDYSTINSIALCAICQIQEPT